MKRSRLLLHVGPGLPRLLACSLQGTRAHLLAGALISLLDHSSLSVLYLGMLKIREAAQQPSSPRDGAAV